jgi:hypothetical protein
MKKYMFISCLIISSCTSLKPIESAPKERNALKQGAILRVNTKDGKRYDVTFKEIQGDSLICTPKSFQIDSVARIEKVGISAPKTALLIGGIFFGALVIGIVTTANEMATIFNN